MAKPDEQKEERPSDEEVDKEFDKMTSKLKKGFKRLMVDFKNEVEESEKEFNEKFHLDDEQVEDEEKMIVKGGEDDG